MGSLCLHFRLPGQWCTPPGLTIGHHELIEYGFVSPPCKQAGGELYRASRWRAFSNPLPVENTGPWFPRARVYTRVGGVEKPAGSLVSLARACTPTNGNRLVFSGYFFEFIGLKPVPPWFFGSRMEPVSETGSKRLLAASTSTLSGQFVQHTDDGVVLALNVLSLLRANPDHNREH